MLTNIPTAQAQCMRNMLIMHPNSMNCIALRKQIKRTAASHMGGIPTIGGMGVLSSEDETDIEYQLLGNGYAMQVEMSAAMPTMMDRGDANNSDGEEFRFLIEPEAEPGANDYFTLKEGDVFFVLIGNDPAVQVKLAYEVARREATVGIPPYNSRIVAIRRDDLSEYP